MRGFLFYPGFDEAGRGMVTLFSLISILVVSIASGIILYRKHKTGMISKSVKIGDNVTLALCIIATSVLLLTALKDL